MQAGSSGFLLLMKLPGDKTKKEFAADLASRMMRHNVAGYAAQTAFFTLLSIFPFLILLISLIQFLNISPEGLAQVIRDFIPSFLESKTMELIDELYSHSFGTISVSIVLTLWSAAKALHSMKYGLDSVNEVRDSRPWLRVRFRAMLQTLSFVLILGLILTFVVFGSYVVLLLEQMYLDNGGTPTPIDILLFFRYIIVFFVLLISIDYAYAKMPNRSSKLLEQMPSAVTCTVIWFFLTIFFKVYIEIFDFYSMYGTLTTVILGLIWVYFMMNVFFGCEECQAEIDYFWHMYKHHRLVKKEAKLHEQLHPEEAQPEETGTKEAGNEEVRTEEVKIEANGTEEIEKEKENPEATIIKFKKEA